jgi:hypothetical protein
MRCVSLDRNCVSQLISQPIFNQEHGGFISAQDEFRVMYDEQGIQFWTKFIITCRDIITKDSSYLLDSVLIKFLAAFRDGFDHVVAFIDASNEQYMRYKSSLGRISLASRDKDCAQLECATKISAGFVRMHKLWLASQPGERNHWKLPSNWIKCAKFEEYLGTLYSVQEFEEEFNCTKEDVPWIILGTKKTQSKKETKQKAGVQLHANVLDKTQTKQKTGVPINATNYLEKLQSKILKEPQVSSLAKLHRRNSKKIPDELKPPDFSRTTLAWLPQDQQIKYLPGNASNNEGFFPLLRETLPIHVRVWNLTEISLPPLLCRKYHTMKVHDLMKNEHQEHFIGVATWSTWWSQTFGINYLSKVHELSQECITLQDSGFKNKEETKNWQTKVDNLVKFVSTTNDLPSEPNFQDAAKKASEFLLEPCILIQLPWNTVMLHQWLVAAFVEVLIIEKASLELRHWPLPPHLVNISTNLLFTVKKLKQRVALGFAILFKQTINHPNIDRNHPAWIMDNVVLPSIPTLEFLLSGSANNICKSIKKLAWSDSKRYEDSWVYMPESVYTIDVFELRQILLMFFYSGSIWGDTDTIYHPFAVKCCQNLDIKDLIKQTSRSQTPEKATNSLTDRSKLVSYASLRLVQCVQTDGKVRQTHTNSERNCGRSWTYSKNNLALPCPCFDTSISVTFIV